MERTYLVSHNKYEEMQIQCLGLSAPLLGCVVFVVSYAISFILNQIPVVNKYKV